MLLQGQIFNVNFWGLNTRTVLEFTINIFHLDLQIIKSGKVEEFLCKEIVYELRKYFLRCLHFFMWNIIIVCTISLRTQMTLHIFNTSSFMDDA